MSKVGKTMNAKGGYGVGNPRKATCMEPTWTWHGRRWGGGEMVADHERLMTGHGHMVAWLHGIGLIHDINSFAWVQRGGVSNIGLS